MYDRSQIPRTVKHYTAFEQISKKCHIGSQYPWLAGEEHKIIKEAILQRDPLAKIYLYGFRTNYYARGGDIDILVISDKVSFAKRVTTPCNL
ncbi:MAG: nucleotidyltransferase domain-containing protein [Balneolales bacterium]